MTQLNGSLSYADQSYEHQLKLHLIQEERERRSDAGEPTSDDAVRDWALENVISVPTPGVSLL